MLIKEPNNDLVLRRQINVNFAMVLRTWGLMETSRTREKIVHTTGDLIEGNHYFFFSIV